MSQWLLVSVLAACGALFLAVPFFKTRNAAEPSNADAVPADAPSAPTPRFGGNRAKGLAVAVLLVGGAAGLYVATEPETAAPPASNFALAAPAAGTQPKLPDVDTMIARIVERLKTEIGRAHV